MNYRIVIQKAISNPNQCFSGVAKILSLTFIFMVFTIAAPGSQSSKSMAAEKENRSAKVKSTAKKSDGKGKANQRLQAPSDIDKGRKLYEMYQCADCHLINGEGCQGGVELDGVGRARGKLFIAAQLRDPEKHVEKNPTAFAGNPNLMPPQNLNEKEISYLVKYLCSLSKRGK